MNERELIVQMRCGLGESERALFSLEAIENWEIACDIRILCESELVATVFPERLGRHMLTVVRVPRRSTWWSDHRRLSKLGIDCPVILLEPGVRFEWKEMAESLAYLQAHERIGCLLPTLYWMFEEQAGEEQWHERIVSEQIAWSGVRWCRGRLHSTEHYSEKTSSTLAVNPFLSIWQSSAFLERCSAVLQGFGQEEVAIATGLWLGDWRVEVSPASGALLAGSYREHMGRKRYGYKESWRWRWVLRRAWSAYQRTNE